MEIRQAILADVQAIAQLEQSQLEAELEPSQRGGTMQGQAFSKQDITTLVEQHWIVIAEVEGKIVGYVMAGKWSFFESWPIYRRLLTRLGEHQIGGRTLTKANCCQYGPIWISPNHRGQGLFEAMVAELKLAVKQQYPYMLTFISEDNERSFAAHTRKASMQVVDFFGFDGRDYYLLATANEA
ncbi:GNAT family N-acetyltransferase [Shewanella mesophila]|uniref:GNAT family N-acetyltransferase n=1 Tax=Shewanella mesophila TaxID=2864208 RepID=UPI001C65C249|nr:GNAT family N-acetyltransferase [Shewanella mesophila]QYJ85599.1 GNAT family N-acetyltransferase [Shewanella mesophila]